MRPTPSIILFTTASGAGYGMLAWIGLLGYFEMLDFSPVGAIAAFVLALGLVVAGLVSSTFHLGHPERAWRAFSQWRSSWLSREGVAAVVSFAPALACAAGWVVLGRASVWWGIADLALFAMAGVTVFTTSMIYASLAAIPAWHNRRVPWGYLMLALATGGPWVIAVQAVTGAAGAEVTVLTIVALGAAALVKRAYWHSIDNADPAATAGSATGLARIGTPRQLEAPHTSANWLTHEMGFAVARKHAAKLRRIAMLLGFAVPAVLLALVLALPPAADTVLAPAAAAAASVGVVVERWLFFAEAKHVVSLFYGAGQV